MKTEFGDCIIVPEGGYHPLGAKGAALDNGPGKGQKFIRIFVQPWAQQPLWQVLLLAARTGQTVMGIPVLKGITDNKEQNKAVNRAKR